MLALSRKQSQSIVVEHAGERLVINFSRLKQRRATALFDGPKSFRIIRAELLEDQENDRNNSGKNDGNPELEGRSSGPK